MLFLLKEKLFKFVKILEMEKEIKIFSDLFQCETTYTISEELNKLNRENLAPQKLAEMNELLLKLETPLPE
jgi:hypothetical protein